MISTVYPYVMFAAVILSTFGYVSFCRLKWHFSFTASIPFVLSCQTLLMMVSGFCHCMKQFSWVMFIGGLVIAGWLAAKSIKRSPLQCHRNLMRFFGNEYLFCFGIFYLAFSYFYFGKDLYWGVDYAAVWYPHFLNLIFNNKWVDSNFHCYASAYCMIGNAYCSYLAHILRDTGTQVYSFGTLLLTIGGFMPLFSKIEWKKITTEGILLCLFCIVCVTFNLNYLWLILLLFILLMLKLFFEHNFFSVLVNHLQIIFISIIGIYLLFAPSPCVWDYPFDGALGGYTIGIFAIIMLDFSYGHRCLCHLWGFIPMLMVLTLIKPTGVIPAMLLSLLIGIYTMGKWIKYKFLKPRKKVLYLSLIIAVFIAPLFAYYAWHFYCETLNWKWHEDFSGKARFLTHLKSGIPEKDILTWRRKVGSNIAFIGRTNNNIAKNGIMIKAEKIVGNFLIKHDWNFDRSFSKSYDGAVHRSVIHHFPSAIILFILGILCIAGVRKHRLLLLYYGTGAFVIYLIVCVNQYYFTPMYTNVPAVMRYLWYGVAVIFAFAICSIALLHFNKRYFICLIFMLFFLLIFKSILFKQHALQIAERDQFYSRIVEIMNSFSNGGARVLYTFDPRGYNTLNIVFGRTYPPKFLKKKDNRIIMNSVKPSILLKYEKIIALSRGLPSTWKPMFKDDSNITSPGFYYGIKNADGKFHFEPLFNDKDAFDLIESTYSVRDWKGLLERRPIKVSSKGRNVYKNKNDFTSTCNLDGDYVKLDVKEKPVYFCPTTTHNFFFDEDVIRFQCYFYGILPKEQSLTLFVHIYNSKKVWKKTIRIPLVSKQVSKNKYELTGTCEMKYRDKPADWNRYCCEILCPVGSKGKMSNIELTQEVSACLDLDEIASAYEIENDIAEKKQNLTPQSFLSNARIGTNVYQDTHISNICKRYYKVKTGNQYTYSVTIKNIGNVPTLIYTGFATYNDKKQLLMSNNYSYDKQKNPVKVISAKTGELKITVQGKINIAKGLRVALDAAADNSDIPNTNLLPNKIVSAQLRQDGNTEITLDTPLKSSINTGALIRICGWGSGYIYAETKLLKPGEEHIFTGTIHKDDTCIEYTSKALSQGTAFVKPIILSYSHNSKAENTIQITDYKFEY